MIPTPLIGDVGAVVTHLALQGTGIIIPIATGTLMNIGIVKDTPPRKMRSAVLIHLMGVPYAMGDVPKIFGVFKCLAHSGDTLFMLANHRITMCHHKFNV